MAPACESGGTARPTPLLILLLLLSLTLGACVKPNEGRLPDAEFAARVQWDGYGVPHVTADDWKGLGYGYGWASARDNLCLLAEEFLTVDGERSLHFGPHGRPIPSSIALPITNLQSDAFFRLYNENPELRARTGENDPREVQEMLDGYAAGYNRFLRETRHEDLPSACRDAEWLRPITKETLIRRALKLQLFASSWQFAAGMAQARPPATTSPLAPVEPVEADQVDASKLPSASTLGVGSNGYAYGGAATANGAGMLLGNPHWVWQGPERFHQVHLTIPGTLNVMGASVIGLPGLPAIGFTDHVAWTLTVSTGWRFSLYELQLVPGDPTSYLYEGQPQRMTTKDVVVPVLDGDGRVGSETVRYYFSRHGPIVVRDLGPNADATTGVPLQAGARSGQPVGLTWTHARAYALRDANAFNDRLYRQVLGFVTADSFAQFRDRLNQTLGIPWINTIAAGPGGEALYADVSVVPNVSNAQIQDCNTPLGRTLTQVARLPVLDGSRAACEWRNDPRAPQPGIIPVQELPQVTRPDYVINSNDSHWLPHPDSRLEGYSLMIGDERTARSPRTRMGYVQNQERLDGKADCTIDAEVDCRRFTLARLQALLFSDRSFIGETELGNIVGGACQVPLAVTPEGRAVDLAPACAALRAWDKRATAESRSLALMTHFWQSTPKNWANGFDARDPVHTPSGFLGNDPAVRNALGASALRVQEASIALDAPVSQWRTVNRNGERIPIHGGHGLLGFPSLMQNPFEAGKGYLEAGQHGNSYIQTVTWENGRVVAHAVLAPSQSTDPMSPHFADQTRLYAAHEWPRLAFYPDEVARDAAEERVLAQ